MIWHNPKDLLPSVGDIILAKLHSKDIPYYVFEVFKGQKDGQLYLTEVYGEQWTIGIIDIVAWISIEELEKQIDY